MGSAAECSEDPTSERNVDGWREQYDSAVRIGNAQDEDLGAYRTDLSRRKVEDRDDQLAAQILRAVMHRQLSATAPGAKWPEIDAKLIGGLAGFRKGLGLEDPADAHVDPLEV